MSEKAKEEETKLPSEVILRSYPKVIFFFPLLFTSLALWVLQNLLPQYDLQFGWFWMIVFFCNLFVIAFDTGSTRLFVIVLIIILGFIIAWFIINSLDLGDFTVDAETFDFGFTTAFYMVMTFILLGVLGFAVIEAQFHYWRIEKNEMLYKTGILGDTKRYPTAKLTYDKEIEDVFEYLTLRAGKFIIHPKTGESVELRTVLNVNKKAEKLDTMLNQIRVRVIDE
ncbi:MAG: hypothetical protein ACOC44_18840 [Promethearchaeia archaeon]